MYIQVLPNINPVQPLSPFLHCFPSHHKRALPVFYRYLQANQIRLMGHSFNPISVRQPTRSNRLTNNHYTMWIIPAGTTASYITKIPSSNRPISRIFPIGGKGRPVALIQVEINYKGLNALFGFRHDKPLCLMINCSKKYILFHVYEMVTCFYRVHSYKNIDSYHCKSPFSYVQQTSRVKSGHNPLTGVCEASVRSKCFKKSIVISSLL